MEQSYTRQARGKAIADTPGQVRRAGDGYTVLSQTMPNTKYTLARTSRGWDCSCPDTVPYCKHAHAVECRLGPKARADRGLLMHEMGGQVERLAPDHCLVKSQSSDHTYEVRNFGHGWMCSCPDHLHTGAHCKHIQAVEFQDNTRTVIEPHDDATCKFCDSPHIIKKGKKGKKQQWGCKACGRRFVQNLGFEGKHAAPEHICTAVEMLYGGMSTRKAAAALRGMGVKASHQTILNWAECFGGMMERFVDRVAPQVGEKWRTDEIYVQIRGSRRYLFAMLDADTRYWIAKQVAEHKGTDDVRPMFRKAKEVAGKVPSKLTSDGAANFAEAHRTEYAPRNFLWKDSEHESHIHMAGDRNNNQMESFNGNTVRLREGSTRGLKTDDSAILSGLHIYHNHVRPHLGLPEHSTPGEAAGIAIRGGNRLKALIQAAAKAERAKSAD